MHYTGTLYKDGSKFDSRCVVRTPASPVRCPRPHPPRLCVVRDTRPSVDRDQPFDFTLGRGMVIKGWDQGLVGMCIGEKRKLVIPSGMGYGDNGSPPKIPGGATLVFEVELLDIKE